MSHPGMPIAPQPTPEQVELDAKWEEIARLREEVVERERVLLTYVAQLEAFEHDHLLACGRRYFELDSLEADIEELLAARAPEDEAQRARAEVARKKAHRMLEETRAREAQGPSQPVKPTEELKALYRRAARQFHPDLAGTDAEKQVRHDYMIELNAAYKRGDVERIQHLMDDWQAGAGPPPDKGVAEQLVEAIRIIARLRTRLAKLDDELEAAEQSDMGQLHRDYWTARAEGRDLIAELLASLDERIERARRRLDELRGA